MRTLVNPPGTEALYERWHFSQAVKVGDMVFVSGQVGVDESGVADGVEAQARVAFRNLARVLEQAGGTLGDVVELTSYHRSMDEMAAFARAKDEVFPADYPAWTAVGVTGLALPDLRVEVRATAVLGSAARA